MKLKRYITLVVHIVVISIFAFGSTSYIQRDDAENDFPLQLDSTAWVDSLMNRMTLEQKIGQLFMVAAYSNKGPEHKKEISRLVEEYGIGGLIFFQGGPVRQAQLTNYYQSKAKIPLLISIDAEWGLAMRLDSTVKYPRQMMLGAIEHDSLVYEMGKDIATQCKRLGIHVNLAPVVDVNNNPDNPVINSRSFGESKENVANKGVAYMLGMQDNNVIANAKHFPGHGDTDKDSHKTLPIINHDKKRLEEIEFYPFRKLMEKGLGSIMIAHLYVPALDSTPNVATTLSKKIVTDLVKKEIGFGGLVFTDALNMKGVSSFYKPGEVELKALLAGNDVLLFAEDVPTAVKKIKDAIESEEISELEINERCKKILMAKQWVGLNDYRPVKINDLISDLHDVKYEVTKRRLVENAITIVQNKESLIPLRNLETIKIASVAIGEKSQNTFQNTLSKYTKVHHFAIRKKPAKAEIDKLMTNLKDYDVVIVGIHNTNKRPVYNFGVTKESISLIEQISRDKKTVVSLFANPYALNKFYKTENINSLVVGYEDTDLSQEYAAQAIFGGIAARGALPVSTDKFEFGTGHKILKPIRMKYTIPEDMGLNEIDLDGIDEIALQGVSNQAYPGCQVLVAKNGAVIYQKSFGHHTYEEKIDVKNDDIYDLASITKIGASLAAIMKMESDGLINLDSTLGHYIPHIVDTTPYKDLVLREILAHQSGLVAWIPFFYKTLHKGEPKFDIYSKAPSETYSVRVAEDFYIVNSYHDEMIKRILSTRLGEKTYKYSDLGYYFFQLIIEQLSGMKLNEFVDSTFYRELGMTTTGYLPRERFSLDRIPPTEYDMLFRKQLVHGDVHDPGAAMLGGVGGHAGLFSNANDLAKLMQMYLNFGTYGGKRYIAEETLKEFSKCQYCDNHNRRGAGFDKPAPHGS
ncbi:MAG: serine hydrolase, partial [Flavobacteriales bacterium]|nr:serine hydrolase [Flavobacteriales bacterium]